VTKQAIKYILVVEDSQMFSRIIQRSIEAVPDFKVVSVASFDELKSLLATGKYQFFASLLDVNLPDAPNGEVIDYVLGFKIPSIIFTARLDDRLRSSIYKKGIVDYVLKEGPGNVEYVVSLLKQLCRNRSIEVLIVDDSSSVRKYISHLLNIYQFNVSQAVDGVEALQKLKENNKISLVIADFNMPKMDGLELTKNIRARYSSKEMAIIGISTFGNNQLSARFLKLGGSDFLTKPFLEEEFFCRINQNMELLEHISELKYLATRDFLTGLHNRRYFSEHGKRVFGQHHQSGDDIAVAILDVDFFKKVNDSYGHDAGDLVLQQLGTLLLNACDGEDIVARFGGEEFCFLLPHKNTKQVIKQLETLRLAIEQGDFILDDGTALQVTVSIGLYFGKAQCLDLALNNADKGLYQAKNNGRNQVVVVN